MKKHTLFSFVDIILAALIFVFTATIATYNFKNNERFDFTVKESITLSLRVKEMPKKYEENVKLKDSVYLGDDTESIGKIKYVSFSNSSVEFLDKLTNTSAIYKSPDKVDMIISVDCEAVFQEGTFVINDTNVSAGDIIDVSTTGYSFKATVIKIEKNEV